ncbi:OmpA family protein [Roseobacter sp. N2S]|uniref:OmpA family protein n=1 Tax=Roseobacter sp. N2S TaxID=2663844 RepID=UPI002855FAA7|nr:OmpA family protein [Roseobacter sp. N2S]MDR6263428.1 chemotaxis protein MotB [Roseobacter sp. N2S]
MSNKYEQPLDYDGQGHKSDPDAGDPAGKRVSSGLIRAGIFGIILFLAIVGFSSVINKWLFLTDGAQPLPQTVMENSPRLAGESSYKKLELSWADTRKTLEQEFKTKRNLLTVVSKTETDITTEKQGVVRFENAVSLAEAAVSTAQKDLADIKAKVAELEQNTPEDAFEQAQLAALAATQDATAVQKSFERAKAEKKRTEITVDQLRRAAKAADAASSASRLVVSAAQAAEQAVSDNRDVMLGADDAAMSNLENNFFKGAASQADSVEKSARAAGKAVLVAEARLQSLNKKERELQERFAVANKEEIVAKEVLASVDKQITAHLEKLSLAQKQRDTAQARLKAVERKAEDQQAALEKQSQLVASLQATLMSAKTQVKNSEKSLEKVQKNFQATEKELKKLHHAKSAKNAVVIAGLNAKLNDQLRQTLSGATPDHPIFDRLVFSSTKLFEPGSAVLGKGGKDILVEIVPVLEQVAAELPGESDWVLRVDGHTDAQPLSGNGRFRDNWELSQARALSVVRFLVAATSLQPSQLSANGYGEFQPLTDGSSEDDLAKNRRIELTLASR